MNKPSIKFNKNVKLIISDVDETIADLYVAADKQMIYELTKLLEEEKSLFLVSGAGLERIISRIVNYIPDKLHKRILVSHCSGSEVWGFDSNGQLLSKPYYSVYEQIFTKNQKILWRQIVQQLIKEFKLIVYPATSIPEFKNVAGDNPLAIMLEDRGPQITLEVVNGYKITAETAKHLGFNVPKSIHYFDIRDAILPRVIELLKNANLPISPRLAGEFALDLAVEGANKTTSVKYVLENEDVLNYINLPKNIINNPSNFEIWGDKFSVNRGGTDRYMSEALPKQVRSIDFREENSDEFLKGYNIVLWDGEKHLHHGLLEYLQSRHN